MQSFRSMEDVQKARLSPKIRQAVERALSALLIVYGENYIPDDCGYVVLIDRTTTDQHAIELFGRRIRSPSGLKPPEDLLRPHSGFPHVFGTAMGRTRAKQCLQIVAKILLYMR